MKRTLLSLLAASTLLGVVSCLATAPHHATAGESAAIFATEIPPGYRDWRVVSVAHEEGDLKDIRAILGNDLAIDAYRAAKLPFPEGAIIGRIAWSHVPSEENNRYGATGGWGYASFDPDGKPSPESAMKTCFPCHQAVSGRDFVFTRYSP
jgi:hypothetical protein